MDKPSGVYFGLISVDTIFPINESRNGSSSVGMLQPSFLVHGWLDEYAETNT